MVPATGAPDAGIFKEILACVLHCYVPPVVACCVTAADWLRRVSQTVLLPGCIIWFACLIRGELNKQSWISS
jgi:hypothetical protein